MIEIGIYNDLTACERTDNGMRLTDNEDNFVLLPNKYVEHSLRIGDDVRVFVYLDHMDRPVATNLTPFLKLDEFGFLEVKEVTSFGAFLNWGMQKDIFCPISEQRRTMEIGKSYLVYMYLDDLTDRLAVSAKTEKFIEKEHIMLEEGEEVNLLIANKTDLGFKAIINNIYEGILYDNEIFEDLYGGDRVTGYVKKIREDEKIDLTLQKQGYEHVAPNALLVLEELQAANGHLHLNDKSDPEDIKLMLRMSKKTFKKAIGSLYKDKLITIEADGIRLVK